MQRVGPLRQALHLVLIIALVVPCAVAPATITIDGTDSDLAPGNGVCSLREAINNSNSDGDTSGGDCVAGEPGEDILLLTTDVMLSEVDHEGFFSGRRGLPVISTAITLEGGGFAITRDEGGPQFGIFEVSQSGTVHLNDITVSVGNESFGGGIFNSGVTNLTNSTLSSNSSTGLGGGLYNYSGATATLVDSAVSGNSAQLGGGIFSYGSTLLTNSTVQGNSATSRGGGIYNYLPGTVTLTNTTVSGNSANLRGGGLYNYGTATLVNSTLSGNSAPAGGSYYNVVSGTVSNSILVGGDCGGSALTDGGANFTDAVGCQGAAITDGVDIETHLASNGGWTQTHALLPGSPAIDAAGACGLTTDQRGQPRDDGACDSGSFEFSNEPFILSVDGTCPGSVTLATSGGSGNGVVLTGVVGGSDVIPGGPCAGLVTGLAALQVRAVGSLDLDLTLNAPDIACGVGVQVIEVGSCTPSNVDIF